MGGHRESRTCYIYQLTLISSKNPVMGVGLWDACKTQAWASDGLILSSSPHLHQSTQICIFDVTKIVPKSEGPYF